MLSSKYIQKNESYSPLKGRARPSFPIYKIDKENANIYSENIIVISKDKTGSDNVINLIIEYFKDTHTQTKKVTP